MTFLLRPFGHRKQITELCCLCCSFIFW